jgi:hypothetical protein
VDFERAIQALHDELKKVDHAIATLEGLISGKAVKSRRRRGRTSMSAEEREVVSERMKRYWAKRRENAKKDLNSAS